MNVIAGILSESEVKYYIEDPLGIGKSLFDLLRPLISVDTAIEIKEYLDNPAHDANAAKLVETYLGKTVERFLYARTLVSNDIPNWVSNTTFSTIVDEVLNGAVNITHVPLETRISEFKEILDNSDKLDFVALPGTKEQWELYWKAVKCFGRHIDTERIYANRIKLYNKNSKPSTMGITSIILKIAEIEMLVKGYEFLKSHSSAADIEISKVFTECEAFYAEV